MSGYKDAYENVTLQSQRRTVLIAILMESMMFTNCKGDSQGDEDKMVMHGDTIVYNADAFNLAEGSMLDALVARLPGARADKGRADIRQRRLVRVCWVNGRDFFSGNRRWLWRTCLLSSQQDQRSIGPGGAKVLV